MRCDVCGTENPEGSKFCINCGNNLEAQGHIICSSCGYENPAGARFCKQCGKDLSEENGKIQKENADKEKYNQATQLLNQGGLENVLKARELFRELADVREVSGELGRCENLIEGEYQKELELAGVDDIASLEQAVKTLTLLQGERECSDQLAHAQEVLKQKKEEVAKKKKKMITLAAVIGVAVIAVIIAASVIRSMGNNVKFDGLTMKLTGDWKQDGDIEKDDYGQMVTYQLELNDDNKTVNITHWNGYEDAEEAVSYEQSDDDYDVSEYEGIDGVDEAYLVYDKVNEDIELYVSKGKEVFEISIDNDTLDDDYSAETYTKDLKTIKIKKTGWGVSAGGSAVFALRGKFSAPLILFILHAQQGPSLCRETGGGFGLFLCSEIIP